MPKIVVKKDKTLEPYDENKVRKSLKRLNIDQETTERILEKIKKNLPQKITTKELYRFIFNELYQKEPALSYKYNLKSALSRLGPAGYPFEKFIAHLFKLYEYTSYHNVFLKGKCLTYEIDVVLEKKNKVFIGECKFHEKSYKKNDLKVVLYSYARYLDIKENLGKESISLVITNTKFTSEAIRFSECYQIKLLSWNYPQENLPFLIEAKKAYPLTIFSFLSNKVLQTFFSYDIILVSDFLSKEKNYLRKISGLSFNEIERIFSEGKRLLWL